MPLSRDDVLKLISYNRKTGVFRHKRDCTLRKRGDAAGSLDPKGYIKIGVMGDKYWAHRLAWLIVHGVWPKLQLDHINRDKADNRIKNLRQVTDSQNRANSTHSFGSSGIRGVSFFKPKRKWRARIKSNSVDRHLGYFASKEKARSAYLKAQQQIFGEFAPS